MLVQCLLDYDLEEGFVSRSNEEFGCYGRRYCDALVGKDTKLAVSTRLPSRAAKQCMIPDARQTSSPASGIATSSTPQSGSHGKHRTVSYHSR